MRTHLRLNWLARAVVLVAIALAPAALLAGAGDKKLDIYWIDVEGGAATLIVTPAGQSVLIDTGNPGHRDANRIFQVATQQAGLRKIDFLVTTHYHGDHFGGAATLAQLMPIGVVYDNAEFPGQPNHPDKAYREFPCERRVQIQPGDELPLKQLAGDAATPLRIRCLGTRQQFIAPPAGAAENTQPCASHRPKDRDGSDNANSVVLLVEFGPFRFFDGGDLTWNVEHRLVCPVNLVGQVDVYQVTHHGLDSSNNPVVLQSLQPRVAVMNNGAAKGCMPEVFANLSQTKSLDAIYQLHKNLRPDGTVNNVADEYIANHERECRGHHIHLAVEPAGDRYAVAFPAHGHRRVFATRAAPAATETDR